MSLLWAISDAFFRVRDSFEALREITEKYGIVLIFDEVMTGFRVAYGGAQEYFKIKPDMTCLGKVIGGGLPVGAYGGKKRLCRWCRPRPCLSGRHAFRESACYDSRD